MNKNQLREIIKGYEKVTERLKRQIILLKYEILLESPELELKYPLGEIIKEIDIEDIEPEHDSHDIIDPNLSIKKISFEEYVIAYV
jgi:hypothetical protein